MASFRIEFARSVEKELRSIDRKWIPKILTAIEALADTPQPHGCKKLVGSEHTYRIRVGDYRIIYDLQGDKLVILIVRIRHRRDVYR